MLRRRLLPELTSFADRLRSALAGRSPVVVERPEARRAAVAIVLSVAADPAILFIKRKVRAGDPWSGQMALPGGFAAASDPTLEATARRETEEETGVALPPGGSLGALDDVSPRTPYLPPIIVTPYVYAVATRLAAVPGPEVDAAVWLGVARLFDPASRRPFLLRLPDATREFESIVVGEYTIWGLTERVLQQLKDLTAD